VFNTKLVPNTLLYLHNNSHIFLKSLDIFPNFLSTSALIRNSFWKNRNLLFLIGPDPPARPKPLPLKPIRAAGTHRSATDSSFPNLQRAQPRTCTHRWPAPRDSWQLVPVPPPLLAHWLLNLHPCPSTPICAKPASHACCHHCAPCREAPTCCLPSRPTPAPAWTTRNRTSLARPAQPPNHHHPPQPLESASSTA
jgi:hypothetical protein